MFGIAMQRALMATSGPFRALCLLLVVAFLLGGGSRADISSLIALRPMAVLALGYGLSGLKLSHIKAHRFVCGMALAILALPALYLAPLPPALWGSLPGRDLVTAIDQAAGLGHVWRPMSLAPDATLNALEALLLPLAALVLGIQLEVPERQRLVAVMLVLGGISAGLGLAQVHNGANHSLYFYKVTNDGKAVGLFANRNHQAFLLAALLPILAVWVNSNSENVSNSDRHRASFSMLIGLLAGLASLPLILITGSRAGLLLAAAALVLLPMFFRQWTVRSPVTDSRSARDFRVRAKSALPYAIGLFSLSLVALTVWLGRAAAWQRLFASAPGEDMRFLIIPTMWTMIRTYFPFGAGMGSFEQVYKVHEPDSLLAPAYMNHAHNDWLELILTGGMPALALLLLAIIAFFLRARRLYALRHEANAEWRLAMLGLIELLLAALASFGDYPLRVPSLSCFFVVAVLWACCPLPRNRPDVRAS